MPTFYINLKNKQEYIKLAEVIDCTNSNEGSVFVLYTKLGVEKLFIRSIEEFEIKFLELINKD